MASLLQDGYYKILFIQQPVHQEHIAFINDFAEQLFTEFSSYIDEPFVLRVGEFHCGQEEYTWQIEIQSTDQVTSISNVDEKKSLTCTDSSQDYFAGCLLKPRISYIGRIEVAVIMAAISPQVGYNLRSRMAAKVLSRLAYMHYYEGIVKHYTSWKTDYVNAPNYSERMVDTTTRDWRGYDTFDEIQRE